LINNGNRNDNCVKERIQAGNTACFANLSIIKIKIISRAAMVQAYKTLIRSVIPYGTGTWTLTLAEENALRMSERKIMRRIYGAVMENNI
jgi:hypothetical protein